MEKPNPPPQLPMWAVEFKALILWLHRREDTLLLPRTAQDQGGL